MKTARFTDVVAAAGRPQVHALWLAPDKDPELRRAVRDCRVMTIHQALRGTKKDHGTVGLHLEGSTQVLVFPKSLRRFGDRHIVGIDYRQVIQPEPKDPVPKEKLRPTNRPMPAVSPALPPVAEAAKPKRLLPRVRAEQRSVRAPIVKARAERGLHHKATREQLLSEINRALRELKAGKTVAAYERLHAASGAA